MTAPEFFKYNPRLSSPEDLEATFVARQAILNGLLDDLRARADSPANQHVLIVGPRGIGKTNLLLMIRHRVAKDPTLAAAYLPLQTAEEEYSIASLRDLFARVLDLLISETGDAQARAAREAMDGAADDDEAAERGITAAKVWSERSGRKLLLLVDNLHLILGEQLDDAAQLGRLRDVLMNERFLVLVGAAPTYFDEVTGHDRPFYNFFRPIDLEDLSPEQMGELLRLRAERDGNTTLLEHADELDARLRTVHHLTGGNPRLALMLYQACTAGKLPEVRACVQALLDDVTPYYKHRLESLAPQARRVMDTFARLGRPATPSELAGETRLPVAQINAILKRLRERGFVRLGRQERRRKTYYVVSERVFRIWHQMRFSASNRRLQFLIEFLRIWYSPQGWKAETGRLLSEYQRMAREGRFAEAAPFIEHLGYMAEAAPATQAQYQVEGKAVKVCIEAGDYARADEVLAEQRERYEGKGNDEQSARVWYMTAWLRSVQERPQESIAALERAVAHRPEFPEALHKLGVALGQLAATSTGAERSRLLNDAIERFEALVKVKPDYGSALYNCGVALAILADEKVAAEKESLLREAVARYEVAVHARPQDVAGLVNLGSALERLAQEKTGAEAEALLRKAIQRYRLAADLSPGLHVPLNNWGSALQGLAMAKAGKEREALLSEAIAKYQAAVAVKPDDTAALSNWGASLELLARGRPNAERDGLLAQAVEKVAQALMTERSRAGGDMFAFYAAHCISLLLKRCTLALAERNLGEARARLREVLERLEDAQQGDAVEELTTFFRRVCNMENAGLCGEFLGELDQRGRTRELGVLEPFRHALEYWQKGKDAEVLDRLNPEMRLAVEAILEGAEEEPDG